MADSPTVGRDLGDVVKLFKKLSSLKKVGPSNCGRLRSESFGDQGLRLPTLTSCAKATDVKRLRRALNLIWYRARQGLRNLKPELRP